MESVNINVSAGLEAPFSEQWEVTENDAGIAILTLGRAGSTLKEIQTVMFTLGVLSRRLGRPRTTIPGG